MSDAADHAARSLAATSTLTTAQARAGINAIYGNANFQGTEQQAKDTALAFAQLSKALQETAPNWTRLQEAMTDPAALMQKLLDQNHLVGLTDEFVRHIKTLQETGQGYKATAEAIDFITTAVSHVKDNETPLEKALHDLSQAFTRTGQDGKSFAESLGEPITRMAATVVSALASIISKLDEMNAKVKASGGPSLGEFILRGISPMLPFGLPSQYLGGSSAPSASSAGSASITPFLQAAAQAEQIDAALLARLQQAEGVFANGQWQMSPTGAIGPMQVTGSTFAGMQRQPGAFPGVAGLTDLSNPQQNVTAGAALFGHLLRKYGDPSLAVLAYHDGETAIDHVLASGGSVSPSSEAIAEARRVTAGYTGTGLADGSFALPPVDITASRLPGAANDNRGFGPDPAKTIADATKMADSFDVAASKAETAQKQVDLLNTALAQTGLSQPVRDKLNEALQQAYLNLYKAIGPAAELIRTTDLQTAAEQRMTDAWQQGSAAAADLALRIKAEDAARQFAAPGTQQYTDIVEAQTAAFRRQAAAQQEVASAQKGFDNRQQLDYLRAEIETLGQSADVRDRNLAILKATQEIEKNEPFVSEATKQARIAEAAATADLNTQLQQNQQALNEIGNLATQAFDQVGQAIAQAFVQGQGAAVNFGNVARAVISSVVQEVLKLAVINPILNSVVGGANRTTLGQATAALGGTSSGGGLLSLLGTGSSAVSGGSSLLQLLGYQGIGGQINGLLGGPGTSLFAGTGIGNGLGGLLSTQIIPGSYTPLYAAGTSEALNGGIGSIGGTSLGGATLGGLLGGVGGGFALGSLGGGFLQSSLNKTGPAPMAGAALGALGGAAIGSIVPGIGTVLGGLFGGALGGAGGGIIKSKRKQNDGDRNFVRAKSDDDRGGHVGLRARSEIRPATRLHLKSHDYSAPSRGVVFSRNVPGHRRKCRVAATVAATGDDRSCGRRAA